MKGDLQVSAVCTGIWKNCSFTSFLLLFRGIWLRTYSSAYWLHLSAMRSEAKKLKTCTSALSIMENENHSRIEVGRLVNKIFEKPKIINIEKSKRLAQNMGSLHMVQSEGIPVILWDLSVLLAIRHFSLSHRTSDRLLIRYALSSSRVFGITRLCGSFFCCNDT